MTGNRFLYGLVGFILVAALLDRYDTANRTNYLSAFIILSLLAFATFNRKAISAELRRLTATASTRTKPSNQATGPTGG